MTFHDLLFLAKARFLHGCLSNWKPFICVIVYIYIYTQSDCDAQNWMK
ncbi:hypothetical protein SLEP1_g58691 [Rubroshorea leprosula]|uniref:Uncharacterized protein n=1 Tax=Rubroshorea leprosula TaxID=152421 RepID=A0AAV5MRN4_9ROSI|nr:hypothetical protein SLEP1_g58691 [Rubroshorea leprosula]